MTLTGMIRRTKLLSALAMVLSCSACEEEPPLLEVHALPQELGKIDITYLPYEYADTGHTYHTPLLAMELAARGIPSIYVMVEDCDGDERLRAPNGADWMYHQALGVTQKGELRVVDPVLSSDFLTVKEFQDAFDDSNSRVVIGEANTGERAPFQCKTTKLEDVPDKVEDMTPFSFDNVMIYCSYMKRFYRDIGGDYSEREDTLVKRVRELTLALDELGLIDRATDSAEFDLLKKAPYCPAPIPSK